MLKKFSFLLLFSISNITYANCNSPIGVYHQKLYLNGNKYLGEYDINFTIALRDIKYLDFSVPKNPHDMGPQPYFPRRWLGPCPNSLYSGGKECVEYTIYPGPLFFKPSISNEPKDIMDKIFQILGQANRGPVRIIANQAKTEYTYTVDHERSFCGPYKF
jgi:hypothetical protein